MPIEDRRRRVDLQDHLALTRQCELAGVSRSTIYASNVVTIPDEPELLLPALIDAEYTRHPFYGSRRMAAHLAAKSHQVNRELQKGISVAAEQDKCLIKRSSSEEIRVNTSRS